MPAKAPDLTPGVSAWGGNIGAQIKLRRKALGVNATACAESAGISRVTLYRIESGVPSVTFGAYLAVLEVLDLELLIGTDLGKVKHDDRERHLVDALGAVFSDGGGRV